MSKTEFCVSSSVLLVKAIREHFYLLIGNLKSGIEFVNIYYALMVKTSREGFGTTTPISNEMID